jgi:hypothetical protein
MQVQYVCWLLLTAPLLLAGCPGELRDKDKYLNGGSCVNDVFNRSCALSGCHLTDTVGPAVANLELTDEAVGDGKQYIDKAGQGIYCAPDAGLMNLEPLIDPNNPEKSLFYDKLQDAPGCGPRMPFTKPKLSNDDKACILDWIHEVIGGGDGGTAPAGDGG